MLHAALPGPSHCNLGPRHPILPRYQGPPAPFFGAPRWNWSPRLAAWNQGTTLDSYQFLYLATELFVC